MPPLDLTATELLVWGLVAHLIADWLLQSDWMAAHKASRRVRRERPGDGLTTPPRMYQPPTRWWDRHPAAWAHAGVHALALAPLFGWLALPLALAHLIIDTRTPVAWWARLVRQTPPIASVWAFRHGYQGHVVDLNAEPRAELRDHADGETGSRESQGLLVDMGLLVRVNVDQVFHVVMIAIAALLVSL